MKRAGWLLVVAIPACALWKRRAATDGAVDATPMPSTTVSVARGLVRNGVYTDDDSGFSIRMPVGWRWAEGAATDSLRLRLEDPALGTVVEVWRFPGNDREPRPRGECAWTFVDTGTYLGPGGIGVQTIGTCVPTNPNNPRVFAWMVEGTNEVWQVEGHVLPAALLRGDAAVRSVIETFALTPPDPMP